VMVGIIDSGGDSSDRPRTSTSSSTRTSSSTTTAATAASTSDSDKHGGAASTSGSSDSSGATDSIYQGKQALTRLGFGPHAIGSRTVACRLMDRDGKVMCYTVCLH
jgi:hypothetical protein